MKKFNELDRDQMRRIVGGVAQQADCTATCPSGGDVTCSGQTCTASDNEGCSSVTTNANGSVTHQAFSCG